MRLAALPAAAALLLTAGAAHAQGNFQAAPIGGRSALMGGTGVALARDGSAPFLNPATILHIDESGVAFSVNFYTLQWTTLFGFHQPGPVDAARYPQLALPDTTLSSSRADALPSTLCLFLTIGQWGDNTPKEDPSPSHRKGRSKLAACLGSLDRTNFDATAVGYGGGSGKLTTSQATSIQRFWNRIYVGPTYSYHVSDRVALGASLHGIATTTSSTWSVDTIVQGGNPTASAYDTAMSAYSIELGAILGLVWHIDEVQVFGASVSTPTVHLMGNYNGTTSLLTQSGSSAAEVTTMSGNFSAPVPVRLSAGMGVETPRLRAEGDLSAFVPITHLALAEVTTQTTSSSGGQAQTTTSNASLLMDGRPVVDASLGLEYFVRPAFSVLGGAHVDFTGLQPLQETIGALAQTRMHQVALSLGIGSYGDASELLLGTQLSYGWGQSIAFDPYSDPVQLSLINAHSYGVMFVIAGGASISAFRRTLRDLGNAVKFPQPR